MIDNLDITARKDHQVYGVPLFEVHRLLRILRVQVFVCIVLPAALVDLMSLDVNLKDRSLGHRKYAVRVLHGALDLQDRLLTHLTVLLAYSELALSLYDNRAVAIFALQD